MEHPRPLLCARIGTYSADVFLTIEQPGRRDIIGGMGDASDQGISGRVVRSLKW